MFRLLCNSKNRDVNVKMGTWNVWKRYSRAKCTLWCYSIWYYGCPIIFHNLIWFPVIFMQIVITFLLLFIRMEIKHKRTTIIIRINILYFTVGLWFGINYIYHNPIDNHSLTLCADQLHVYTFQIYLQTTQRNYTKLKRCARILLPYIYA